ncbi:MAG: hypothetical protein QGD94_07875 [Planctomycetia bacterium]|nr:hypothetical protein [Planctomycetia bacterium]
MSGKDPKPITKARLALLKQAFSLRYTDLVLTPEQEEYFEQMRKTHGPRPSKAKIEKGVGDE